MNLTYSPRRLALLVIGITALAAFVRLETWNSRPIWYDEIFTLIVAQQSNSLADVWAMSGKDGGEHPVLFYTLSTLSFWSQQTQQSIRWPSLVFGILTIPLLYLLGSTLFTRTTGAIAALLMTLSVYHIDYSQDGRSYALTIFLVLLAYYSTVLYLRENSWRSVALLILSHTILLYAHHVGILVLLASGLIAFIHSLLRWREAPEKEKQKVLWKKLSHCVATVLGIGVLFFPQSKNLLAYATGPNMATKHRLLVSPKFLEELIGRWGNGVEWSPLFAILILLGLYACIRKYRSGLSLVIWGVMPFIFFSAVSFEKFFDIRFLITTFPIFFLLVALGIVETSRIFKDRLKFRGSSLVGIVLTLGLCAGLLSTFIIFRGTKDRCGNFFYYPEIMENNDGFCKRHLILNSLYKDDEYILTASKVSLFN